MFAIELGQAVDSLCNWKGLKVATDGLQIAHQWPVHFTLIRECRFPREIRSTEHRQRHCLKRQHFVTAVRNWFHAHNSITRMQSIRVQRRATQKKAFVRSCMYTVGYSSFLLSVQRSSRHINTLYPLPSNVFFFLCKQFQWIKPVPD